MGGFGVESIERSRTSHFGLPVAFFSCSGAFMGVPVAQKSDSWVTVLAMTDSGGPIKGGRGGAVEQRGLGDRGTPVSPPERVCTPPAPRLAAWRLMSSPGPLQCSTPR